MSKTICAWCDKDLGPSESEMDSHGMCKECACIVFDISEEEWAEVMEGDGATQPAERAGK